MLAHSTFAIIAIIFDMIHLSIFLVFTWTQEVITTGKQHRMLIQVRVTCEGSSCSDNTHKMSLWRISFRKTVLELL